MYRVTQGSAEEAEEEEEEEKIGPASPSAIASVRKIVNACDYLATFNEDSLRDAVASAFDRLEPEDLEDAYVSFEVIYRTLRNVRNWHKGADRNE